ncbi:MAG: tRNA 2-thiouridine(34) synthase MnmA, partial [Lachnospiraceae bacterium]|nr:tRNA 2-thiouridine(34) synthase MnmA [Lachnospiraceae bacterium]
MNETKKALIAMSGGVDSSVAAKLTQDAGYECIGCMMKLYDLSDEGAIVTDSCGCAASDGSAGCLIDEKRSRTCCSADDAEDARSVAYRLGMPFYVFNFKDDFRKKVIDRFVESYLAGITPNPCIECNRYLKFDRLWERAKVLGCEKIVTGHYARIIKGRNRYELHKGLDASKDQSYVLFRLTQELLAHTLFPLGEMTKEESRRIADANGFVNASKPDSQDICFVPDGDYAAVIRRYSNAEIPGGDFVDTGGKVLGRHKGIIHYTIGQRRGLGISAENPLYVVGIDVPGNKVILGSNEDLFSREVKVGDFNWIPGGEPADATPCLGRIRYHHKEQPGLLY